MGGLAGGCPGPHPGGEVGGLAGECLGPEPGRMFGGLAGGPRPTSRRGLGPCLGGPSPGLGGVSQHALRQTPPPSRRLLLQAVRILLECILVLLIVSGT